MEDDDMDKAADDKTNDPEKIKKAWSALIASCPPRKSIDHSTLQEKFLNKLAEDAFKNNVMSLMYSGPLKEGKYDDSYSLLIEAAQHLDSDAFQALLRAIPKGAITEAVLVQTTQKGFVLHNVEQYQDKDAVTAFLVKINGDLDPSIINTALNRQDSQSLTPLRYAASRDDPKVFEAFLDNMPSDVNLAQDLLDQNGGQPGSALHSFKKKNPAALPGLLAKISRSFSDQKAVRVLLSIQDVFGATIDNTVGSKPRSMQAKEALIEALKDESKTNEDIISLVNNIPVKALTPELLNMKNTAGTPILDLPGLKLTLPSGKTIPGRVEVAACVLGARERITAAIDLSSVKSGDHDYDKLNLDLDLLIRGAEVQWDKSWTDRPKNVAEIRWKDLLNWRYSSSTAGPLSKGKERFDDGITRLAKFIEAKVSMMMPSERKTQLLGMPQGTGGSKGFETKIKQYRDRIFEANASVVALSSGSGAGRAPKATYGVAPERSRPPSGRKPLDDESRKGGQGNRAIGDPDL
jgi:hypothetical protein